MALFEKFGEFNSVEELNLAAEGFKNEGDIESLKELAAENGIELDDVEDYIEGDTKELATLSMAVYGRLDILQKEEIETKTGVEKMPLVYIMSMLRSMAAEPEMQKAIMQSGKRIQDIYNALKNGAKKHKSGDVGVSCGTDRQLCEIIKTYFTEAQEKLVSVIDGLYS